MKQGQNKISFKKGGRIGESVVGPNRGASQWAYLALVALVLTSCGNESVETPIALDTAKGGVFLMNDFGVQDLLESDEKSSLQGSLSVSEKRITFTFSRSAGNRTGKMISPNNDAGVYIFYPESALQLAALRGKLLLAAHAHTQSEVGMEEVIQARQTARKGYLKITAVMLASAPRSMKTREQCKVTDAILPEDSPTIQTGIPGEQSVEYEVRNLKLAFHGRFLNEADETLGYFSTTKSATLPVHTKEISRGPCKIRKS